MKRTQKSLVILLVVCMVLVILPMQSFALDGGTQEVTINGKVFKSDGVTPVAGVCVYLLDSKYAVDSTIPAEQYERSNSQYYEVIDFKFTEGQYAHAVTNSDGEYTITANVPAGAYHTVVDYAVDNYDSGQYHIRKVMASANVVTVGTTSVTANDKNITLTANAGLVSGEVVISDKFKAFLSRTSDIKIGLVPYQLLEKLNFDWKKVIASSYTANDESFTLVAKNALVPGDYAVIIYDGSIPDAVDEYGYRNYEFSCKKISVNNNLISNVTVELEPGITGVELYPGSTDDFSSLNSVSIGDTIKLKRIKRADDSYVTDPDTLSQQYQISASLCEGFSGNTSPWWDEDISYIGGGASAFIVPATYINYNTGEENLSVIGKNIYFSAAPIDYMVNEGTDQNPIYKAKDNTGGLTSLMAYGPIAAEPVKASIAITGATVVEKTYDGDISANVSDVTFSGLDFGDTLTLGQDYVVENAFFDTPDAGTNKQVTAIVRLTNPEMAKKYRIENANLNTTGTIKKAVYNGAEIKGAANVIAETVSVNKKYDLASIIPLNFGVVNYGVASTANNTNVVVTGTPSVNSLGMVTYDVGSVIAGNSGDIQVSITSQNYSNTVIATITVSTVNKTPVTISGVTKATGLVYNGSTQSGYTGTVVVSGNAVPVDDLIYTYTALNTTGTAISGTKPIDAGDYRLVISVPSTNEIYSGISSNIDFTIDKKSLIIKPRDENIYNGAELPIPKVEYSGLAESDNGVTVAILSSGNLEMEIKDMDAITRLTSSAINGTYPIEFTGSPVFNKAKNYNISTADGTLTINKKSSGGGSGKTPAPTNVDTNNTGVTTSHPSSTVTGKTASSTVSSTDASKLVSDAVANKSKEIVIAPEIKKSSDVTKTVLDMPASAIKDIVQKTKADVKVETPVGNLTFDAEALDSIANQVKGSNISISVEQVDVDKLSEENKEAVGDSLVIDLTITSNNEKISNFGEGTVTVSVPYKLKDNESAEGIAIWYLADDGTLNRIKDAYYDSKTGSVVFTTNHFSYYVVGYDELAVWDNPFTDIKDSEWYYENVYYVNKNGLMNGTSKTIFSPNGTTNRGMVVTILWRLEGSEKDSTNRFSDVGDTWYTDAVAWTFANGIVSGYGNDKFGPADTITREQMASIIYNYAKYKGYDVTETGALAEFSDSSSVSIWAKDAMSFAVKNGIMSGKGNNKLDPKATATRAEVAAIMQRTIEKLSK